MSRRAQPITREEVKHLASLARIDLTRREEILFAEQLSRILTYFKKIDEANVRDVEPTYHVLKLTNRFRADEPRVFSADEVLKGVPQRKGRFVKAPKMV